MQDSLAFILKHGYTVLFAFVFAEQVGLPIPAVPMLLAAGALIGSGQFHLGAALATVVVASLAGDLPWYWLGKRRGSSVLSLLCKISLEPDSCIRRTENLFIRWGEKILIVAKFVPGLGTAAPPLAGMFHMSLVS